MKLLKQALATLGALVVLAAIVALIAPQRVHAVAATLVQIIPGSATHVGQNESKFVNLDCTNGCPFCSELLPDGSTGSFPYAVPSGSTLINYGLRMAGFLPYWTFGDRLLNEFFRDWGNVYKFIRQYYTGGLRRERHWPRALLYRSPPELGGGHL